MKWIAISLLASGPVMAQDIATFDEFVDFADGKELRFSGHVSASSDIKVQPLGYNHAFFATLAVDRDTIKSLEPCRFDFFGEGNCQADFAAEIDLDDGPLRLLVFEVKNLVVTE